MQDQFGLSCQHGATRGAVDTSDAIAWCNNLAKREVKQGKTARATTWCNRLAKSTKVVVAMRKGK